MDSVLFWNREALRAVAQDHSVANGGAEQGGPTFTSRALAMVHGAIYDANNSFAAAPGKKYLSLLPKAGATSVDYAICGAAYTTLLALYPAQRAFFNDAMDLFQTTFGNCDKPSFILGEKIGYAMIAARVNDGAEKNRSPRPFAGAYPNSHCDEGYRSGMLMGMHTLDPLNIGQGYHAPTWGNVKPFVVPDITPYRAPAPPALTSARYKSHFEEVKRDGELLSSTRTPEQTETGIFWAYDGANEIGTPPRLYNQIAAHIAEDLDFTRDENARYFALVNLALADAGIACWDTKYFHNIWRPIVGIRGAEAADADPAWMPLGAPRSNTQNGGDFSPNFPAYTSGHATFGAASMEMMKKFVQLKGKSPGSYKIEDFVSDELNGQTTDSNGQTRPRSPRTFTLQGGIDQNLESRVYLGIHWRFDGEEGVKIGKKIADDVFAMALTP